MSIHDIEKIWTELNSEYIEMSSRLKFVARKGRDSNILEKRPIKDKLILLMSDFRDIINTMEKVCHSIDEIHADQGTINTKIKDDSKVLVKHKHINNNGKVQKIIEAVSN